MTFVEVNEFMALDCTVKSESGTYSGIIGGDDTVGISITNGANVWVMDCESILAISENVGGSLSLSSTFLEFAILAIVVIALFSSFKENNKSYY